MNILIICHHTGLGNLMMFLHAVRLQRLDVEKIHEFSLRWFHNSRHFRSEEIEFAKPHTTEKIDVVFVLYPNFFIVRRIKTNCPVLGFQYRIKGINVPFYLTRSLKWDSGQSEITNNMSLLNTWQEFYFQSAAMPAIS